MEMYEIEVVETIKERVKSHYVGYIHKYDEWKLKSKIKYQPPPVNQGEDPSVRVQIPFDKDLFHSTLAVSGTRVQDCGEKIVYTVARYNVLNEYLGENWHLRVNNVYGNFSYRVSSKFSWFKNFVNLSKLALK